MKLSNKTRITLVVLVIIILVGISILVLSGNYRLLSKVNQTKEKALQAEVELIMEEKKFIDEGIISLITVKSSASGIKQINVTERNLIIQGNNKDKIAFDIVIQANREYIIDIELANGTKKQETVIYKDEEGPTATINLDNKVIFGSGIIKADVSISDNRSGVKISECKWVVSKESENIGIDPSLYTGGTFTRETQQIKTPIITEEGEYYIHLLLKDNIGNISEIVSEAVKIKHSYEISTPEELQGMRTDLEGNYFVTQDIDMTGFDFKVIKGYFTGTLDGQGHTISNLTISSDSGKVRFV